MTEEEIKTAKAKFIEISRRYISRDGLESLLIYLNTKTDFFTAPSSISFHMNEPGGLCQHSLNVFEAAMGIYGTAIEPKIRTGHSPYKKILTDESIAIACLFHDLCKTNYYTKKIRWKKDEEKQWFHYSTYEVNDSFPFGHGEKSCMMINWFMKLQENELLAIRWHMGMFEMTENGSSSRYAYKTAMEKSPLVPLLQTADMIAANCYEKKTKYLELSYDSIP